MRTRVPEIVWGGGLARHLAIAVAGLFLAVVFGRAANAVSLDPAKVVGPDACAECHKDEVKIWQHTHHYTTYRSLPHKEKAREIAHKMGLRRIKEGVCLDCHFTSMKKDGRVRTVAGISCESCHGAAKGWIKVHSNFSGKKKETETPAEAALRWKKSEAAGMIRPKMMYAWAKNCYSCHIVPKEKLVNVGGHTAGSAFELVSWSQGEIRHNVWYTKGKSNPEASQAQKRKMFVVGAAVELEESLRAVGKATERANYAVDMARRAQAAAQRLVAIDKALNVPEIHEMIKAASGAHLRLNNDAELTAIANKIGAATKRFVAKYDGKSLGAIDGMIPGKDLYKGTPTE